MGLTVADYLKTRLEQLGLDRMFGVAGTYTAALLDTILAEDNTPISSAGKPNEMCAGFAADAYARYKGIGAVYVTYSVGAFSALNQIAGSYVERVPVVLINSAPISPCWVQASACSTICSLYFAENRRRLGFSRTSGSLPVTVLSRAA